MVKVPVTLVQIRNGRIVEEPNTPAEQEALEEILELFGEYATEDGDFEIPEERLNEFENVAWPFAVQILRRRPRRKEAL